MIYKIVWGSADVLFPCSIFHTSWSTDANYVILVNYVGLIILVNYVIFLQEKVLLTR